MCALFETLNNHYEKLLLFLLKIPIIARKVAKTRQSLSQISNNYEGENKEEKKGGKKKREQLF